MQTFIKTKILFAILAFAFHLPVMATTLKDSVHLKEVQVQSSYIKPSVVIPAQVLDGKRLEGLNSHSVADAIRYFAGVQIKDYGGVGGIKTVDIRSMGSNHMGVFYDGIQLGNAQNGQIDLGKFSLDNIEEISLYNGQKSNIFQSAKDYGSAGTIYLRSKVPVFTGGKRFNGNVTMKAGSFGLINPSARFDYQISGNVSATASIEFTKATGKYKFRYRKMFSDGSLAWDTTAVRQNGDITATRAELGFYGKMVDGRWNAKLYFYDSEKGIPGAIVNNVWKTAQRQWDRNFFA
ncbi:MAG: TonB-dependent receptor plug domain-containing protein, partial [Bacteroidaceae bacterium]|nr:TonB-dependent receptor plug domain-containing protein [Bacteroidaceae bacterium]